MECVSDESENGMIGRQMKGKQTVLKRGWGYSCSSCWRLVHGEVRWVGESWSQEVRRRGDRGGQAALICRADKGAERLCWVLSWRKEYSIRPLKETLRVH